MSLKKEFSGVDLADERLNVRLLYLAECFSRRHGGAISFTCPDWKGAKSAYRFFDNERFDENSILLPRIEATQKRVSSIAEKVLILHATTEFHLSEISDSELEMFFK